MDAATNNKGVRKIKEMKRGGYTFFVVKDPVEWRVKLKGWDNPIAKRGKTKKEALERFKSIDDETLIELVEYHIKAIERDKVFEGKERWFKEIFGVSLMRFSDRLIKALTGHYSFNIIGFDEWLRTPDDVGMDTYITEKYGKDASELVKSLL
jgi:hypothetical protein